jgi:hypothetical protein
MSLIQATRGGKDNDPDFFSRFQPTGVYADMLRTRFNIAIRKLGLDKGRVSLRTDLFRGFENPQLSLL